MDGLTVLIGTDTWPQNLYVRDQSGSRLRVTLAAPPLIPFQPGDSISVLGRPSQRDQKPFLESATACLTDIALLTDPTPPPAPIRGQSICQDQALPLNFTRIQGRVLKSGANGFVLDDGGQARSGVPRRPQRFRRGVCRAPACPAPARFPREHYRLPPPDTDWPGTTQRQRQAN